LSIPNREPDTSSVFRDARTIVPESPLVARITLLDPVIETAAVFRLFLDLVHSGRPDCGYWMPHAPHLTPFLKKWGCDVALRHFFLWVKDEALSHSVSPLRAFAVLAAADQDMQAADVVKFCAFDTWSGPPPAEYDHGDWSLQGRDKLAPYHFPLYMFTDVPPAYTFALARAFAAHRSELGKETEPGIGFANTFIESLEKAKAAGPTREVLAKFPEREEPY
jgi:hypothetical protein